MIYMIFQTKKVTILYYYNYYNSVTDVVIVIKMPLKFVEL